MIAMQNELNQFEKHKFWALVDRPLDHPIIKTKWIHRNKLDENGIVVRNKIKLVTKGYNQEEDIEFDETYTPVVRLEASRQLLTFVYFINFKLYQIDIKSIFLNKFTSKEVYIEQPFSFKIMHCLIILLNCINLCMV